MKVARMPSEAPGIPDLVHQIAPSMAWKQCESWGKADWPQVETQRHLTGQWKRRTLELEHWNILNIRYTYIYRRYYTLHRPSIIYIYYNRYIYTHIIMHLWISGAVEYGFMRQIKAVKTFGMRLTLLLASLSIFPTLRSYFGWIMIINPTKNKERCNRKQL